MTTDYTSPEFLTTPMGSDSYENLDWHNKIKIKALEGLDQLSANLNAIANIKAIEFQLNHLNNANAGFTEQLQAKDKEIAALNEHLLQVQIDVQQQIADMAEANQAQIDQITASSKAQIDEIYDSSQAQIDQITASSQAQIDQAIASSQAQVDEANAALAANTADNQAQIASNQAAQALLQAEIASLKAANESLTENFNKFKSVLTSIDQMTDEVIS